MAAVIGRESIRSRTSFKVHKSRREIVAVALSCREKTFKKSSEPTALATVPTESA